MKLLLLMLCLLIASSFNVGAETIILTDQNTMSLNGPVDNVSMTSLMVKLQELNKIETEEPIYLVLNSPGGSVYAGFDFIRFAETSKRKIHTITIFAASMAFQIVESLGNRYVTSYSSLMSHRSRGSLGNLEMPGNHDTRYSHFLSHMKEQDTLVVNRTKGKFTTESYAKLIQDEYWANAEKAVADGFADKRIETKCDKSLEGTNSQLINILFFTLKVEFSNCPLITAPLKIELAGGEDYVKVNNVNINTEFNKLFEVRNIKY